MNSNYTSYEDLPLALCAEDVAAALGISRSKAYELLHTRGVPSIALGRRLIIPKPAFLAWLNAQSTSEEDAHD